MMGNGGQGVVIFVNGYWNTGRTAREIFGRFNRALGESIQRAVVDSVGAEREAHYWQNGFISLANAYFTREYQRRHHTAPAGLVNLFFDGADIWKSSGRLRYSKGLACASTERFRDQMEEVGLLHASQGHELDVYFVSHSMGGAYAEGLIAGMGKLGVKICGVLHFSPADTMDFCVNLPEVTYQINLLPDPVLLLKNRPFRHLWRLSKPPFPSQFMDISRRAYSIKGLQDSHMLVKINHDILNHYYTKSSQVWELIDI